MGNKIDNIIEEMLIKSEKPYCKFLDNTHKEFFYKQIERCKISPNEVDKVALIYLLALICRGKTFDMCYDKDMQVVMTDALDSGWVTSSCARTIRLAFNLFCWNTPTANNLNGDKAEREKSMYYPINIFDNREYREYFFEAIRIRFGDVRI